MRCVDPIWQSKVNYEAFLSDCEAIGELADNAGWHCGGICIGLGGDGGEAICWNKGDNLAMIARHAFVYDGHLFGTQVATGIDLTCEATENFCVTATEAYVIIVAGASCCLFVGGLQRINAGQSAQCPCAVGGELMLNVVGNVLFAHDVGEYMLR